MTLSKKQVQKIPAKTVRSTFRPSQKRLETIAKACEEALLKAKKEDLYDFEEN